MSNVLAGLIVGFPVQTVMLAKEVFPHLTGRVHAQTSPTAAYDTQKTITHAEKLIALFEASGIPM
jgi:transaldolase